MNTPPVCICCLIGLPASLKSTSALKLQGLASYFTQRLQFSKSVDVNIISLDNIAQTINSNEWNRETWHQTKQLAFEKAFNAVNSAGDPLLLIIDDNHPYHSMRLPYKRLAIQCNASFATIYFDTPLHHCLERNSKRTGLARVPEKSIHNIALAMEVPKDCSNIVYSPEINDIGSLVDSLCCIWQNGPPSPPSTGSRVSCPLSTLSAIDIALKRSVSILFKSLDLRSIGKKVVELRKTVYGELKSQEFHLELESILKLTIRVFIEEFNSKFDFNVCVFDILKEINLKFPE
ncbi:hypothetical protein P9112_004308 [Eukaryota sp. TZLM1-RC]